MNWLYCIIALSGVAMAWFSFGHAVGYWRGYLGRDQRLAFQRRECRVRKWTVTVHVEGEYVLTIEDECYSGVANVSDFREEIVCAADNLIAFIGRDAVPFIDWEPDATATPDAS